MKELTFTVIIDEQHHKVWQKMWSKKGFEQWTSIFAEGSHYKGTLSEGNEILFLTGEKNGMYSTVEAFTPPTFIRFLHLGDVTNGQRTKKDWNNAFEEYILEPQNNKTQLQVRLNVVDDYIETMNNLFPKALLTLKNLIEQDIS